MKIVLPKANPFLKDVHFSELLKNKYAQFYKLYGNMLYLNYFRDDDCLMRKIVEPEIFESLNLNNQKFIDLNVTRKFTTEKRENEESIAEMEAYMFGDLTIELIENTRDDTNRLRFDEEQAAEDQIQ